MKVTVNLTKINWIYIVGLILGFLYLGLGITYLVNYSSDWVHIVRVLMGVWFIGIFLSRLIKIER